MEEEGLSNDAILSLLTGEQLKGVEETQRDLIGVAFAQVAGAALILRAVTEDDAAEFIYSVACKLEEMYPFLKEMGESG